MKKIILSLLFANTLFANDTSVISGQTISDTIDRGDNNYYLISASSGDTITSQLSGLNDDANLYVRVGSRPTSSSNDCHSTNSGTQDDSCAVTLDHDATVYVRVHGRRATDYQITVNNDSNNNNNEVLNLSDSVEQGEMKHYTLSLTAGQTLNSLISELTEDADLYVKIGEQATTSSYDCHSTNSDTQSDGCSVTVNEDSTVDIGVHGYHSANYRVSASVSGDANVIPTLTSGETVSGSVARNDIKYYKINALPTDKVTATITGLTDSAHLYLKKGEEPTKTSYHCRSVEMNGTPNSCSLSISNATEVYIGISGFRASDYILTVTAEKELIPENPAIPTVLEDAEDGTLNPNWITYKGDKPSYIYPTPNIEGAPSGTGVLVQHASGASGSTPYIYLLPLNNTSQRVLSMDMGGLPTHKFDNYSESYRGYIPHYGVGVIVETKFGERTMTWDSWYTHQGYSARKHDNGHNVFLNYPSPVEMVRGWYAPTNLWVHFEVNLDDALHVLEPDNEIYRIVMFKTTGGYLDNITLSATN
jgi:hypothetical protein